MAGVTQILQMTSPADWKHVRILAVDVEGNGQIPPDLIELGIIEIRDGVVSSEAKDWLIRPARPITSEVIKIHGISNQDVDSAPTAAEISAEVLACLGEHYVVAHNAPVDVDVLTRTFPGWHPKGVIDTLQVARELLPDEPSHSLRALTNLFGLSEKIPPSLSHLHAHRAAFDAALAANLLLSLIQRIPGAPPTVDQLIDPKDIRNQGRLF